MAPNKLWHGTFNWAQESYELYTHASNADRAFVNFTTKLSKQLGLRRYAVAIRYINPGCDNYHIQEVIRDDNISKSTK